MQVLATPQRDLTRGGCLATLVALCTSLLLSCGCPPIRNPSSKFDHLSLVFGRFANIVQTAALHPRGVVRSLSGYIVCVFLRHICSPNNLFHFVVNSFLLVLRRDVAAHGARDPSRTLAAHSERAAGRAASPLGLAAAHPNHQCIVLHNAATMTPRLILTTRASSYTPQLILTTSAPTRCTLTLAPPRLACPGVSDAGLQHCAVALRPDCWYPPGLPSPVPQGGA